MRGMILTFIILFSLMFVLAAPIETWDADNSFAPEDPNVTFIFNVSIDNIATNTTGNLSEVEVTYDDRFSLISASNGTTSTVMSFSESSNTLTWSGDGLVMNQTKEYFWVSFTTPTNATTYDFDIGVLNSSGTYATATLTLTINDNVAPQVTIVSPSTGTYTEEFIWVNISINEKGTCWYSTDAGTVNFTLNSNGDTEFSKRVSFPDGKEELWAYCQDEAGNWNVSEKTGFTLKYEDGAEETTSENTTSETNETNQTVINETTEEDEEGASEPEESTTETTTGAQTGGETAESNTSESSVNYFILVSFLIGGIVLVLIVIKLFTPPK